MTIDKLLSIAFSIVISIIVVALFMAPFVWVFAETRLSQLRKRDGRERDYLTFPLVCPLASIVGLFVFIGIPLTGVFTSNETMTPTLWAGFLAFASFPAYIVFESIHTRHRLIDGGLEHRKYLLRKTRLKWRDVESVKYVSCMKWLVIRTRYGYVARISIGVKNVDRLAAALLDEAPPSAVSLKTHRILTETANGKPPKLLS